MRIGFTYGKTRNYVARCNSPEDIVYGCSTAGSEGKDCIQIIAGNEADDVVVTCEAAVIALFQDWG